MQWPRGISFIFNFGEDIYWELIKPLHMSKFLLKNLIKHRENEKQEGGVICREIHPNVCFSCVSSLMGKTFLLMIIISTFWYASRLTGNSLDFYPFIATCHVTLQINHLAKNIFRCELRDRIWVEPSFYHSSLNHCSNAHQQCCYCLLNNECKHLTTEYHSVHLIIALICCVTTASDVSYSNRLDVKVMMTW